MVKIKLHWQILIALVIAIFYGLYFKTTYKITDDSIKAYKVANLPESLISQLIPLKNKEFKTKSDFKTFVVEYIGFENSKTYLSPITKKAYHNNPVLAISWLGDIFLRALKMLIIPLIFTSIISGIVNIGSGSNLGRLGLKTFSYYILTSLLAIITGLFFVNLFKPGLGADINLSEEVEGFSGGGLRETLIEIVPDNIVSAMAQNQMLSMIFFALLFGFFVTRIDEKPKKIMTDFFNASFSVMMKITMFIIRFTPLGIFGIVAKVVADQTDMATLISSMGKYMGTVLLALCFHALITLPLIVKFIGKTNPIKLFSAVTTPLLTAFSTSSSGATLPLTMTAVEKNCGVSTKISSFTLPLGATINMDGTALYECVAVMFIAQAYPNVEIGIYEQIVIVITSLLASIGAAAIPMAGLVMMTVILTAVGLPLEGIGLILAVDRILDMFRTSVNVWSDTCGAVVIAKSEGETLKI